jgi:uncharacterized protein YoxC
MIIHHYWSSINNHGYRPAVIIYNNLTFPLPPPPLSQVALLKEKDAAVAATLEKCRLEREAALAEAGRRAEEEMARTIQRMEGERARVVAEYEGKLAHLREEKKEVEKELDRKKERLDECVGKIDEMEHAVKAEHQRSSFDKLKMLSASNRMRTNHAKAMEEEKKRGAAELAAAKDEHRRDREALEGEIEGLERCGGEIVIK